MHQRALLAEIQQLKKGLQEVETRLAGEALPLPLLEEFKEAVDHVRTTLWAVISSKADPDSISSTIVSLRMKRATEMCRQIILDMDAHEIGMESPELPRLREILKLTHERVHRLYTSAM
jgi:hypothetical protein